MVASSGEASSARDGPDAAAGAARRSEVSQLGAEAAETCVATETRVALGAIEASKQALSCCDSDLEFMHWLDVGRGVGRRLARAGD